MARQASPSSILRHPSLPAILSACLALALYAVSLHGTFIWDDVAIIQNDPRLASPIQWKKIWTKDYFNGGLDNLYRPLITTSLAAQKIISHDRAWLFHLVNILLHAAAAAAVAELTRRLVSASAAFTAGFLFAAHPVHVEVVSGIVGQSELLCTLAILAALLAFIQRPVTPRRAFFIFLCVPIAILSKEQGILLPFLLLLFAVLVWNHPIFEPREKSALKWLTVLIAWTTAAYLTVRESFLKFEWDRSFLDPLRQPLLLSHGIDRILMPFVLLGRYTQLLLVPLKLAPDYGSHVIGHVAHLNDPYIWLGFLSALAFLAALAWSLLTRRGLIAFCLIAAALTYSITSNIFFLIVSIFAERWLYLPSAFLVILAAIALAKLSTKIRAPLIAVLLILYSLRTVTYAWQWNDETRFLTYAQKVQPRSSMLVVLVAEHLRLSNQPASAEAFILQRLPSFRDCWDIWSELALDAAEQHHWKTAEQYANTGFYMNIGVAMTGQQIQDMKAKWLAAHPNEKPE